MSRISVARYTARAAPPSEERFLAILDLDGPAEATQLYESYRASDPRVVLFSEATLNTVRYRLLQAGRTDDAVDRLIASEREILRAGEPPFHAVIVARPKAGLRKAFANVRYFTEPKLKRLVREVRARAGWP